MECKKTIAEKARKEEEARLLAEAKRAEAQRILESQAHAQSQIQQFLEQHLEVSTKNCTEGTNAGVVNLSWRSRLCPLWTVMGMALGCE